MKDDNWMRQQFAHELVNVKEAIAHLADADVNALTQDHDCLADARIVREFLAELLRGTEVSPGEGK
jgi:hypothetical protein